MNINNIILNVMVIFMLIGAVDKIIGNKFGLGEKFDEGFKAMGPLALAMLGIVSLAPVLAKTLGPIIAPVYTVLGADPSMFAGTLLACDMGGYSFAVEIAKSKEAALLSGLILSTMMGTTVVFTIPIAIGILEKEDHKFLARGVLAGIITIPIGCIAGGLTAGFEIGMILSNLVPIIIFAGLTALGLFKIPETMIKGFNVFGKGILVIGTIALASIIVETLTGIVIIPGMAPLSEGIQTVGNIAIVLAGAYPMVYAITQVLKVPLMKLGGLLGMGEIGAAGIIASMANNIPMFGMMKEMDDRGKIINAAFAVSGAFVFGGQLGFVAGVNKDMIVPMIVAKLAAGFNAVLVACFIAPKNYELNEGLNEIYEL